MQLIAILGAWVLVALVLLVVYGNRYSSRFPHQGHFCLALLVLFGAEFVCWCVTIPASKKSNKILENIFFSNYEGGNLETAQCAEGETVGKTGSLSQQTFIFKTEHINQGPEAGETWTALNKGFTIYNDELDSKRDDYKRWFYRQFMAPPPNLPHIKMGPPPENIDRHTGKTNNNRVVGTRTNEGRVGVGK